MTEDGAREILGAYVGKDDILIPHEEWVSWVGGGEQVTLDGNFSPEQLEAIAWWIRNKAKAK